MVTILCFNHLGRPVFFNWSADQTGQRWIRRGAREYSLIPHGLGIKFLDPRARPVPKIIRAPGP